MASEAKEAEHCGVCRKSLLNSVNAAEFVMAHELRFDGRVVLLCHECHDRALYAAAFAANALKKVQPKPVTHFVSETAGVAACGQPHEGLAIELRAMDHLVTCKGCKDVMLAQVVKRLKGMADAADAKAAIAVATVVDYSVEARVENQVELCHFADDGAGTACVEATVGQKRSSNPSEVNCPTCKPDCTCVSVLHGHEAACAYALD